MKEWYRRHPALIAYVLVIIAGVSAILWQNHLGQQRREQICYAEIEDRLLWKDTISYLSTPSPLQRNPDTLPPAVQELIKQGQERSEDFYKFMRARVAIPPTICDGTNISEDKVRSDQIRRGQRADPTATTTTEGGK